MRGYSLPELIVVTVIFTALTGVLTLTWIRGCRGVTYSDRMTARLNQLTLLRHRLDRELAQTHGLSVQTRPTMLCFALQPDDYFRRFGQWDRLCLYYYDSTSLYRRELDSPLDHPLETYAHGGVCLATDLSQFSVTQMENLVEVRFLSGKIALHSGTRVRN